MAVGQVVFCRSDFPGVVEAFEVEEPITRPFKDARETNDAVSGLGF
jgi:hypothetical protein